MLIVGAVAKAIMTKNAWTPTPHPSPQGGGDRQALRSITSHPSRRQQPLHFPREFETQLRGLFLRQPAGHLGEDCLVVAQVLA